MPPFKIDPKLSPGVSQRVNSGQAQRMVDDAVTHGRGQPPGPIQVPPASGVGAGRVARKPRRVRGKRPGVYVRLTPELKQDLDAFCSRAGISMNAGISAAIAFLVHA